MNKEETIQAIKNILKTYGCFATGELDYIESIPAVNIMGSMVALAEYFTEDYVEVNIYQTKSFSSDAIETYEEQYENLGEEVLHGIHQLCEQWEAETLQTEKRIQN